MLGGPGGQHHPYEGRHPYDDDPRRRPWDADERSYAGAKGFPSFVKHRRFWGACAAAGLSCRAEGFAAAGKLQPKIERQRSCVACRPGGTPMLTKSRFSLLQARQTMGPPTAAAMSVGLTIAMTVVRAQGAACRHVVGCGCCRSRLHPCRSRRCAWLSAAFLPSSLPLLLLTYGSSSPPLPCIRRPLRAGLRRPGLRRPAAVRARAL